LNIFFIPVEFSFFFFVVFVGGALCLFILMTFVSGSVYFGRVSLEFLWRAGSYFLSVWSSAVWNVGLVQFIWALAWGGWRGSTGFSSLWLCCGEYGTIHLSAGRGWAAGLYSFFFWYYLSTLCL
jgi:hypothetical protein